MDDALSNRLARWRYNVQILGLGVLVSPLVLLAFRHWSWRRVNLRRAWATLTR